MSGNNSRVSPRVSRATVKPAKTLAEGEASKSPLNQSSNSAGKYAMKIKKGSVPFSFPKLGWALTNKPEETLDVNQGPIDRINFLCRAPDQKVKSAPSLPLRPPAWSPRDILRRMDGLYSITRSDSHKQRMKGLFGTYFGGKALNVNNKRKSELGTPRSQTEMKSWKTIIELEICQAVNQEPESMGAFSLANQSSDPLSEEPSSSTNLNDDFAAADASSFRSPFEAQDDEHPHSNAEPPAQSGASDDATVAPTTGADTGTVHAAEPQPVHQPQNDPLTSSDQSTAATRPESQTEAPQKSSEPPTALETAP
eukprot:3905644-Rhodomonas_salina.1